MKKILMSLILVLIFATSVFAQNGLINPDQIAGATPQITATAGENINANDIVKIINQGGAKAYKYLSSITSNNIINGTASVFESANSYYISAIPLSSTQFVVCYCDGGNSSYGTAIVGTVSGTTLSWGTASVFESAYSPYISAIALSSTQFVVCYCDGGNSSYGTAIVGTVSGTTLSWGTASVFESAYSPYISAIALSSTQFVVCYRDDGNSSYGTAIVGTVSGTTLSWGTASVFESASSLYISAIALSSTQFVVCYCDDGNSSYGTAIVGTVSGTTLSWGTASVFESANSTYISAIALSSTQFVVCYRDGGNSYYGTAIVGTARYTGSFIPAFSTASITSGNSGTFKVLRPFNTIKQPTLSLSTGTQLFLDSNSALTSEVSANYYIGFALSTTELYIDSVPYEQTAASTIPVSLQRK